ncbi:MAG: hypothetical protein QOE92_4 [Chloroflexota bacterium]|jgi:hypothetical protein|nr:hypothetical protein [Chloroflexota bacterium]
MAERKKKPAVVPPEAAGPTPEAAAPAEASNEATAGERIGRLWHGFLHYLNRDIKWALLFAGLGFAISWLANVVITAVVFDGFGKVPPGGPVTSPTTQVTGSIFWAIGMAILMGLLAYRRQVGGKRFWADLRGFPTSIVGLVRHDGQGALGHILWGFAGAMLAAAFISPAVGAMLGLGVLVLVTAVLRPLITGLIMIAWRKVIGALFPQRAAPPKELTLAVVLIGSVIALAATLGLPFWWMKLGLAIAAGVLAFVLTTRGAATPPAAAMLAVGALAALGAALASTAGAFASDGGWRECGTDVAAWLRCGGPDVMKESLLAGAFGGFGGMFGGGVGGPLGADQVNKGWKARLEGGYEGFLNQMAFQANRDVTDPLLFIGTLSGAPGPQSEGALRLQEFLNSGQGRSAYEEFAADPLGYANKRGLGEWLRDYPETAGQEDSERYRALIEQYNQAVAAGDDRKAGELEMMAAATTVWTVGSLIDPEVALEGVVARAGTKGAVRTGEHMLASELEQQATRHAHLPGDIPLDAEQFGLVNKGIKGWDEMIVLDPVTKERRHVNDVHRLTFEDDSKAVFKGGTGQKVKDGPYGPEMYRNDLSAHTVDRALGFDIVPTTAAIDHPTLGRGSVQAWADAEGKLPSAYSIEDQHRMATLDYIIGNGDRHDGNIMSRSDGRVVAIDHGNAFPRSGDQPLRSDFVVLHANEPLHPDVIAGVNRVDPQALAEQLRANGMSHEQIDGVINRLNEVKTNGMITGEAHAGDMLSANRRYVQMGKDTIDMTNMQPVPKTIILHR